VVSTETLYLISVWLLPVLVAITFHEAAHGFVARFLGDNTASRLGRVSLNPIRHIDPIGTVLLPGLLLLAKSPFLFGYAKPVPVNFQALRNPRIGMVIVAAAGPAMNIGLAIVAALGFHLIGYLPMPSLNGLPRTSRTPLSSMSFLPSLICFPCRRLMEGVLRWVCFPIYSPVSLPGWSRTG